MAPARDPAMNFLKKPAFALFAPTRTFMGSYRPSLSDE